MTAEARNWLTRWRLRGSPKFLPWDLFSSIPEEAFDYLPETSESNPPVIRMGVFPEVVVWQLCKGPPAYYALKTWGFDSPHGLGAGDVTRTCETLEEAKRLVQDLIRDVEFTS